LSVTPARNFPRLAAAIVVAAVVIGASIIASYYLQTATRQTGTTTEIGTTTLITPSTQVEPNGSLLLSKSWGPWTYDLLMNSTSVGVGGALLLSVELTYHGQANTTIEEVDPTDSVSVSNSAGGWAWGYMPGAVIRKATMTPGETLGGYVCIPITTTPPAPTAQNHNCDSPFGQPVPGEYSIEADPTFWSSSGGENLGDNLRITANFTIF
jgi:hypothetical protein